MSAAKCTIFLLVASAAMAAEPFPRVPPTPPEKAESTFEVQHGFLHLDAAPRWLAIFRAFLATIG